MDLGKFYLGLDSSKNALFYSVLPFWISYNFSNFIYGTVGGTAAKFNVWFLLCLLNGSLSFISNWPDNVSNGLRYIWIFELPTFEFRFNNLDYDAYVFILLVLIFTDAKPELYLLTLFFIISNLFSILLTELLSSRMSYLDEISPIILSIFKVIWASRS